MSRLSTPSPGCRCFCSVRNYSTCFVMAPCCLSSYRPFARSHAPPSPERTPASRLHDLWPFGPHRPRTFALPWSAERPRAVVLIALSPEPRAQPKAHRPAQAQARERASQEDLLESLLSRPIGRPQYDLLRGVQGLVLTLPMALLQSSADLSLCRTTSERFSSTWASMPLGSAHLPFTLASIQH